MPRGQQANRRAGPIPHMDVPLAVRLVHALHESAISKNDLSVQHILDPQIYGSSGESSLKTLVDRKELLTVLVEATARHDGHCKQ